MSLLKNPETKYRAFVPVHLRDRRWPDAVLTKAPIWCSVDLRDGNQALIEPMNRERKLRMFQLLVKLGFKEIEVGFPSASQTEFDFIRHLIENDLIPEDVTIQVLTQAREPLIVRTFEALKGAKKAILHYYNATAPVMRRVVFGMSQDEVIAELAVKHAVLIKELAARQPETQWTFQYSPEMFSGTELDFAKRIVDAVTEVWAPTPEQRCIINLPSTVEHSTPNIFADMIEFFTIRVELMPLPQRQPSAELPRLAPPSGESAQQMPRLLPSVGEATALGAADPVAGPRRHPSPVDLVAQGELAAPQSLKDAASRREAKAASSAEVTEAHTTTAITPGDIAAALAFSNFASTAGDAAGNDAVNPRQAFGSSWPKSWDDVQDESGSQQSEMRKRKLGD